MTDDEMFDGDWTPVRQPGQRRGKITDRQAVLSGHNNRDGHRLYVKVNQSREGRRSIVGFGRWRKPREKDYESHARLTAVTPMAPRAERRPGMIAAYRAQRKARLRNGR